MAIYLKDKKITPYRGDYKPVNIYQGAQKIAGWRVDEKSGTSLEWSDTYNDKVVSAVVPGASTQVVTVQSVTNPIAEHVIPFTIGDDGIFDMQISNVGSYFWVCNGTKYIQQRLQLSGLAEGDVVWLCYNSPTSSITLNNN